ncbi:MAG: RimK/LysX family protein [Saprospiraceae bacterium]|nr:RimK/LysX family protein [Saprospiraceae bacterium]
MAKRKKSKTLGRTDVVDFPSLELYGIAVKIDTGAYTSSIHCHNIRTYKRWGKEYLRFNLLDPEHHSYHEKEFRFTEFTKKVVKNSFGESEERFVIETDIVLFDQKYKIELSLSNRENMRFPVLLGRKLLEKGFVVDVSKINLSFEHQLIRLEA